MKLTTMKLILGIIGFVSLLANQGIAHDGRDPVVEIKFQKTRLKEKVIASRLGPDVYWRVAPQFRTGDFGEAVSLNGRGSEFKIGENYAKAKPFLPQKSMTVSTWVTIHEFEFVFLFDWLGKLGN